MKITVIYSVPTRRALATPYLATDQDTKESAQEVGRALKAKGAEVILVPISEDNLARLESLSADLIFNLIEWDGLDLPLSLKAFGMLEALKIPFTGCSLATLEKAADKIKMKEALDLVKLPTPTWQLFTTGDEPLRRDLKFPVIVKLVWEHCSIGLTRDAVIALPKALIPAVKERISLFKQPVYIEEFLSGREFQVTILEQKSDPMILPAAEIIFKKPEELTFLTFKSRWDETHPEYKTSTVALAKLTPKLKNRLEEVSLGAWKTFACRDVARIDLRCRGEEVFILEVNPNPGLGEDEEYGMTVSQRAAGLTFPDFIWEITRSALRRPRA